MNVRHYLPLGLFGVGLLSLRVGAAVLGYLSWDGVLWLLLGAALVGGWVVWLTERQRRRR